MTKSEAWWFFEPSVPSNSDTVLDCLEARGLTSRHPFDGMVYILEGIGARRSVSRDFVAAEWRSGRVLTLQLWITAETDVIITAEPGGTLLTFDMDGLNVAEADRLVALLLLSAATIQGTGALVVDRDLPDRRDEWERAIMSAQAPIPYEPELLMLAQAGRRLSLTISPRSWLRTSTRRPGDRSEG